MSGADVADLMQAGTAHHCAGRFAAAIDTYTLVLAREPERAEAWRLLGIVALQTGDRRSARDLVQRALRIEPNDAATLRALAAIDEADSDLEAAYAAYNDAYRLDPTAEATLSGLSRVALRLGRTAEACAVAGAALERGMRDAGLLRTLGAARWQHGDYTGAAQASLAALQLERHADAFANLAAAYTHLNRLPQAISACRSALELDPIHAQAHNTLGIAQKHAGDYSAALAAFERAIACGSLDAHVNLGTTRLLLGDYRSGWPQYGWETAERRSSRVFRELPMWSGTDPTGKRILVVPEQGAGDTIQMVRFLQTVQDRGASVTLACRPALRDLFSGLGIALIDDDSALDGFDLWLPTIRLPVVLDVEPAQLSAVPYLAAEPKRIERLRPSIEPDGTLRIGLVWSGSPQFRWNENRSCGLQALEALRDIADVTWYALQQGPAVAEQQSATLPLVPINAAANDFADTAAIIAQLDAVVSVDTSVAHLTGALGKPGWVLLSNRPDWRWLTAGDVSPWYPTLRLLRQGADGAWESVIAALGAEIRAFRAAMRATRRT